MQIKIRKSIKGDCHDLWVWRNDPRVRKWAFNSSEIKYADHKKWFNKKFKDPTVKIYIAENEKKEKLGQVRFEISEGIKAHININLNPDFFKKGLGNLIIKAATALFFKECAGIEEVIAEVIDRNTASIKAFQTAGYLPLNRDGIKIKGIFVFLKRRCI
jgi:RimJ/RimL family protein N-acetyltransferase